MKVNCPKIVPAREHTIAICDLWDFYQSGIPHEREQSREFSRFCSNICYMLAIARGMSHRHEAEGNVFTLSPVEGLVFASEDNSEELINRCKGCIMSIIVTSIYKKEPNLEHIRRFSKLIHEKNKSSSSINRLCGVLQDITNNYKWTNDSINEDTLKEVAEGIIKKEFTYEMSGN